MQRLDRGFDALTFAQEDAVTDPYRIARPSTLQGVTAAAVPALDAIPRNLRAACVYVYVDVQARLITYKLGI